MLEHMSDKDLMYRALIKYSAQLHSLATDMVRNRFEQWEEMLRRSDRCVEMAQDILREAMKDA